MEVIQVLSSVAAVGFVLSAVVQLIKNWLSSPTVEQVVKMVMILKNSLPPAVINIGNHAVMLVKYSLQALIELVGALPPVVIESIKNIVVFIAQTLHLVIHLAFQVAIFIRHLFNGFVVVSKGVFVVIRSFNDVFTFIWNFPETHLPPLVNWMFAHPVSSFGWQMTLIVVLMSILSSYFIKNLVARRKLKQN